MTAEEYKLKIPIKELIKAVDDLWRDAVKKRDNYKCIIPGCKGNSPLNAHHIIGRAKKGTRFDLLNGLTCCGGHHFFVAHQFPEKFKQEHVFRIIGEEKYNELYLKSNQPCKCDRDYLYAKMKELQYYFQSPTKKA